MNILSQLNEPLSNELYSAVVHFSERKQRSFFLKKKEKEMLALLRRWDELWKAYFNLPLVPVKPYQDGWKKSFIVRADIARSKFGPIIQSLLDRFLQNEIHSRNKDFTYYSYKSQQNLPIPHHAKAIRDNVYDALTPTEKKYFYPDWFFIRWSKAHIKEYKFDREWMFDTKIVPHIVTHKRLHDGDIKAEIDLISEKIWESHQLRQFGGAKFRGKRYHGYRDDNDIRVYHRARENRDWQKDQLN